jgi:peptidoglycan hydrolase CwlO-like protein
MKYLLVIIALATSLSAFAQQGTFSGQLNPEDQKYYKNESGAGLNQLERIDSSVKEINKIYGELAALKTEVAALKKEVSELKGKK